MFTLVPLKHRHTDTQTHTHTHTVHLAAGFLEVRGHLVDLFADDVTKLLPGEITQDALGLIEEDTSSQQALVDTVQEGQTDLTHTHTHRLSMMYVYRIFSAS